MKTLFVLLTFLIGVFVGGQSLAQGGSDDFFQEDLETANDYQPKEGGCKDLVKDFSEDEAFLEEENSFNKSTIKEENTGRSHNKRHFGKSEEEEIKKEEMSTLSFNLFLYIVDRFKEE
ncbi:hypothetical protein QWY93_07795 [Echinicola jeungdonensis]|uniref:Uncharacterized protein n=1 Tax=Echinicola jeungdonensis TaxID=709343 RepID=A0ABV5J6R6_9BACT|nr:hypothetical protein [Echinicola jeungdonensis]MDN3669227.1 hypothetical protein [Echinicola jeungdonensis]